MKNLSVSQLGMKFDDWIFQGISFDLEAGAWLTVVGKSGNGKSLMLKVIAGLIDASTGSVYLDGKLQSEYEISTYRQAVSYVTQSAHLFGQTVRDNLDLPFIIRNLTPDESTQLTGLAQMDLPAEILDREINELSGGQRQRVGLLRNLLFPPKVLLLDEISTGLDEATKRIIWQVLAELHAKTNNIMISVTHDSDEIANAKMLLTIEKGRGVLSDES